MSQLNMSFDLGYKVESNQIGKMGEDYAIQIFRSSGYLILDKLPLNGDFRAICPATDELFRIEVKTAQCRTDLKYCFHLVDKGKDFRWSDALFLICISSSGNATCYLVPCSVVGFQKTITIPHPKTKPYNGRWANYIFDYKEGVLL